MVKILTSHISYPLIAYIPDLLEFIPEVEGYFHQKTIVSIQKFRIILARMLLCCLDHVREQDRNQVFCEKLIKHFKSNVSKNLSLEDLSRMFFISQPHLERLIFKEFGCGAIHLFHRFKIDHACRLLHDTTIPVVEVAANLGYEDQSHFSRIFKKHTGLIPRDYRKQREA